MNACALCLAFLAHSSLSIRNLTSLACYSYLLLSCIKFNMVSSSPLLHCLLFKILVLVLNFSCCLGSGNLPNGTKVEMAKGFNVYYGNYYKVAENFISNSSFLIVQDNTKFAHLHQCQKKLKSFVAPLANYSVDTFTVPVSYLELLGMFEPLGGVTTKYVSSPCLSKHLDDAKVPEINQTDPQQIQTFSAHLTTAPDSDEKCNFVSFNSFGEETPLQRAEWIKYIALFMNLETRANDVFDKVKANYMCLRAAATNASEKPTVAWVSFNEGIWTFSKESYKLQYILDAGGTNLEDSIYSATYNMSLASDVESFQKNLCSVDVIIDETFASCPSDYTLQTFTQNAHISEYDLFPFMLNQSIWRYDKQDQGSCLSDWLDRSAAQPHIALADIIHALHHLQPNYSPTFLRNLAQGEQVLNSSDMKCTHDKSTPLEPTSIPCTCCEY